MNAGPLPKLLVTGTIGKSTILAMLAHVLAAQGAGVVWNGQDDPPQALVRAREKRLDQVKPLTEADICLSTDDAVPQVSAPFVFHRTAKGYCSHRDGTKGPTYLARDIRVQDSATLVRADLAGQPALFKLGLPGRHFAMNALGVLALADRLGVDLAHAMLDLATWRPAMGQGVWERIVLDAVESDHVVHLIDACGHASPASLSAALDVLSAASVRDDVGRVSKGRRIAYLSDLDTARPKRTHRGLAKQVGLFDRIEVVHCAGVDMRHLWSALPKAKRGHWCEDPAALAVRVARDLDAGDVVLVKGSPTVPLTPVVEAIRKMHKTPLPLDDTGT